MTLDAYVIRLHQQVVDALQHDVTPSTQESNIRLPARKQKSNSSLVQWLRCSLWDTNLRPIGSSVS